MEGEFIVSFFLFVYLFNSFSSLNLVKGLSLGLEFSLFLCVCLVVRCYIQISLDEQVWSLTIARVSSASFISLRKLPCVFDISDTTLKLLPLLIVIY